MTPEQFAQFEIFNQLNFWGGLFLGLIIAGFLKTLNSCLNSHIQRPRRIRFANLNGRHERKDNFEYLYLYKNEYYTLEQRDFLQKERLKKFKQMKSSYSFSFPVFIAVLFFLLIVYFSVNIQNFGI